uniref:FTH domain-containing protein n=1 Tax=Caenorhabditis tropicalis TaxID=1561998 RepID=A0A1I7TIW8_9PELO
MPVKSVSIQTEHLPYFEQILFSLKPGILEEIKLFNVDFPIGRDIGTIRYNEQQIETVTKREEWGDYEYADLETLQRIVEMKQFKEAKRIRWHHRTIQIPITHFFNFESFELSGVPELKTSDLETLKKLAISNDSKKPFKSGLIYRPMKLSIVDASKVLGLCQPLMEQCTDTWHLKVPQSMDRMVFYLGEVSVFTRRLTPGKTSEKKKRKKKRKRVE